MILLTGATGTLGRPLLSRLIAADRDVRCLVREPRRLGASRVQVQIAIGNLADSHGFDRALRGVDTIIHLASTSRDQGRGSIERINGIGTARLVNAATRAGVRRFIYVGSIGASRNLPSRFIRSQALARDAVASADFESLIFESSMIYAPGDRWMRLLRTMSRLPVLPVAGKGRAQLQPIWAEDAADAMMSALLLAEGDGIPAGVGRIDTGRRARFVEMAGPQALTHNEFLHVAMRSFGRDRPLLHLPRGSVRRLLRFQEWYLGPSALATWDEAVLMDHAYVTARGTADVEGLGVQPLTVTDVLGG